MIELTDPVALTQALIRCPSITPEDAGALDVVEGALGRLGFRCHRLTFATAGPPVANLYARYGRARPTIVFAGHTDVVPPGDLAAWRAGPFAAELIEGHVHGRGAVDMKGAIACFIAATARLLAERRPAGSIGCLITGDEEGPAIDGTQKVLAWLRERGEALDACLVGEPTNPEQLGEMIKIGRRGSMTGRLTVHGVQGHVAYPERADNPIPRLLRMLAALSREPLDQGSAVFQPSRLVITSIDVGNPASNVIPAAARATFNIRFNDRHTPGSLEVLLREQLRRVDDHHELAISTSGEAFVTAPGPLSELLAGAIQDELGRTPERSTSGGTSDARFIKDVCPVVEFGLVGRTMHQVDERVAVADLEALTRVYRTFLERYLALA
ncbi:MAG TPA: succinyl-diaminopimelate desuccinylase [Geminicoccaceae bacterium]|nr:succinyl-diaminopimelate desuccinylase [Geminicoccaceae bacterium]